MGEPILIVGTGALACLFAARLAAVGAQVTMLGSWQAGLDALRTRGVRLLESDEGLQTHPVYATSNPADCAGARLALVLVKSWQTGRAACQLADCLAPAGLALTLQNGLGNREKLVQALGAERVALGVITTGATLVEPGQVRAGGEGNIALSKHPRLGPMFELLTQADFALDVVPDADDLLWSKLVINAAINPLTALLRAPNGALLERPAARALLGEVAREAAAVAQSLGRSLSYPDPAAAVEAVAQRTASNHSSMYQDVLRGAPTEIDAICGAIAAAGESNGVPTPLNRTLWLLVRALREKGD